MTEYRRVKGTRDLLPPETAIWAAVEATARRVFALYGYQEVRTPVLEHTELFVRSVGEASDIVGKEMYTFQDRGERSLTLRPENTASVARAIVENGLAAGTLPIKLFYIGPQFRYERPQKGRYRQFHQIGAELVGDASPWSDVELLLMLDRFLRALGYHDLEIRLNTLGDRESRERYKLGLQSFLRPLSDRLSEDSQRRLETNPLRILDTKSPAERELIAGAPRLDEYLTDAARSRFAQVCDALRQLGLQFAISQQLVRGLDYYTDTVFEVVSRDLGAQDALVGGGRYDGLLSDLGGPALPGIGFAIGEDRLIDVLPAHSSARVSDRIDVLLARLGKVSGQLAVEVAEALRGEKLRVEVETERGIKAGLKQAARRGAAWVVFLGDDELASRQVGVKNLHSGEQHSVPLDALPEWLRSRVEAGAVEVSDEAR
jgi:histidyl-tRNA synthetase